jgi:hypothetical protein
MYVSSGHGRRRYTGPSRIVAFEHHDSKESFSEKCSGQRRSRNRADSNDLELTAMSHQCHRLTAGECYAGMRSIFEQSRTRRAKRTSEIVVLKHGRIFPCSLLRQSIPTGITCIQKFQSHCSGSSLFEHAKGIRKA